MKFEEAIKLIKKNKFIQRSSDNPIYLNLDKDRIDQVVSEKGFVRTAPYNLTAQDILSEEWKESDFEI